MNRKQIIIIGCFVASILAIGFFRGLIFAQKSVSSSKFDLVALAIVIVLAVIAVVLGRTFGDKKG